jgi:hypothetical protein
LTRNEPSVDAELRRYLPRAYDLKSVADYVVGPNAAVPAERVEAAIMTATRLVDCITALLETGPESRSRTREG